MISRERDALAAVHTKRIPGLVWWPNTAGPASDVMHHMVADQVAIVTLDHPIRGLSTEHVSIDHVAAGAAAAEHLLAAGRRRIAMVAPPFLNAPMLQRQSGISIAVGRHGAPGDMPDVLHWSSDAGERALLANRLAGPERPYTALICLCDWLAVEVLLALRDIGAAIPDEIAVVGFDASHECEIVRPTLTTVVQPLTAIGAAAAHMVVDRLERRITGPCRSVTLPSELKVQGSSRSPDGG
ncbi:MAG: substrate-binding domain-containing protein [Armatimonadetes bacterium]|nr:substrate-binding domain-containing protein [Armatimonadota bacterium]